MSRVMPPAEACVRPINRDIAGVLIRVALVSVLVGLAVSLLDPTMSDAPLNILYSECIGLSIAGTYMVIRAATGWRTPWSLGAHLVRAVIAVPIGFTIGLNLASWLSGRPVGLVAFNHVAPFALVITAVGSVGFVYYFWSRNRMAESAAAAAEARRAGAEAQLRLLQTQIEPHMLFNTLANLRTLVEIDPPRAQTMIDELIVYLRATLSASRRPLVPLAEEFAQLRAYLELMKVRMAHRLDYALELPEAHADAKIPPMLLQPLVENAIKHGLEPKIPGGRITVTVSGDATRLVIDVSDDGVGLVGQTTPGYGLTHVRERLAALHGDAALVRMNSNDAGGVTVRLELPR